MAHDYAITVDGTLLVPTLARSARFLKYTSGAKRGGNLSLPYRDGEYADANKFFTGADVLLEVSLPASTDTAADQALSELDLLFGGLFKLVTVQQTAPHKGQIRALVELITEAVPTQDRLTYLYPLRNPAGFWEDVSASSATSANPPSVTTGGNRPIDDMVLTAAGPGFLEHTDSQGRISRITIDAAAGAGTYVVDVGAGTVKKSGVDQDRFLTVTQPWWMRWEPDRVQSFTSNVAWSASWRNKWA